MEARLTLKEHEARVLARASSFRVTVFLGRGRYDVRRAATLVEARYIAVAMPGVPMIYAIAGCHQVHIENAEPA